MNPVVPYIALDYSRIDDAHKLLDVLKSASPPRPYGLKIGLELFSQIDREKLRALAKDYPIFLDLKIWDIPRTLKSTVVAFCELGVSCFTFHATGGLPTFRAVASGLQEYAQKNPTRKIPRALAVTVLTSYAEFEWQEVAQTSIAKSLRIFATVYLKVKEEYPEIVKKNFGWVCSGKEVEVLSQLTPDAPLVVPGIRWESRARSDDQTRTLTPEEVQKHPQISAIVVGRPITQAADPGVAILDLFTRLG